MILILLSGCQPSAIPQRRPISRPPNKKGVHLLLDDGRHQWPPLQWPAHMQWARTAVGAQGFVTQLIRLDDLDVEKWQLFLDLCADQQLTPIIRLATTYDPAQGWWTRPPPDGNGRTYENTAETIAAFVGALTWPTDEHYLLVGNEPNHGDEWGGRPDPAAYGQFLKDVALAVKTADPQARILNAGLDPYSPHTGSRPFSNGLYYLDSETFIDEMVAAHPRIFDYLDAWASHPYPLGPFIEPPHQEQYQIDWLGDAANPGHQVPPPAVYNRGIHGYRWELWKLSTYGQEALPVFITETGWRHSIEPYPTAKTAGLYLTAAYQQWLADVHVYAVTPFALDGQAAEWAHTSWLKFDEDGRLQEITPLFTNWQSVTP